MTVVMPDGKRFAPAGKLSVGHVFHAEVLVTAAPFAGADPVP
jgi:hypothetical protein